MRNSRNSGLKPINKVFSDYPNCYFSLHEGLAGADPGDIADQAGTSLTCVPETTTTAQWTTKPGWWSGIAANAADALHIRRAVSPTEYDSIFSLSGNVVVIMCRVFADTDPGASGRLWVLGNLNPDTYTPFEIKYLTDGSIDSHVEGPGGAVAGTGIDLPAEAAPNESILVFKWDDINSQVTWYCYKPGTKTLQIVSDTDSTATLSVPTAIPSNQEIVIGGNTVGVSYTTYLQNMSVRDFRAINFGSNPPDDLSEIIEELAINSLIGTRR